MEGLDSLAASFREQVRGLDAGELHVAAGSSTILYLLPGIVDAFRQRHPDVRLSLHNVTGASGLDLLRSDGVDLAVGSMLDVPADLTYAPVYRFEPMLITPPDHPLAGKRELSLEDLSPYGLILPPQAPDHLPPGRPGVPAEPGAVHGGAGGGRLGGDQAVRGDGPGHQHRHRDLPDRGRPRSGWRRARWRSGSRRAATAW